MSQGSGHLREKGLLLDTQVFLWWRSNPGRILPEVRELIATTPLVFVSSVSIWEASIKAQLGKLRLPEPMSAGVAASGMEPLHIRFAHAEEAASLPLHHEDPFDRMLIAQSRIENLPLITTDMQLKAYDAPIIRIP